MSAATPGGSGDAPADPREATATADGRRRMSSGPPPATQVDRYILLRPLGEGGMGVVFEAFDPELDRNVALKLLHPLRGGTSASRRLLREAQLMARLSHPNVVQIHDAGEFGDSVFLVMELVRGETLRAWLRGGPPPGDRLRRFIEAGRGLAAAHAAGIIHRDFKPDNVLIGGDGRVRVADFGLANVDHDRVESIPELAPRAEGLAPLTATGTVMGTPMYMAPEQHLATEIGPAADQFAFCVAVHEAMFGLRPFAGEGTRELVANVVTGQYRDPPRVASSQRWLQAVLRRGLAVDPRARYADMDALLDALGRDPARTRRRWLATVGGTGVLFAAGWAAAGHPEATCTGERAALASVWDDSAHATVLDAQGIDLDDRQRLVANLDDYAARWSDAHRTACTTHRDGAMSDPLFDRAMACIERRSGALAAVLDVLSARAVDARGDALAAAARLQDPQHCLDRAGADLASAPPEFPEVAREVEELRQRLASAKVRHDAGLIDGALTELAAIDLAAQGTGYTPLLAETALTQGLLAMDRGDWPTAADHLDEATAQALVGGVDRFAAEALARKLFVDAMASPDTRRILAGRGVAAAMVTRAGSPSDLEALLANNLGVLHGLLGDRRAASEAFSRAATLGAATQLDPIEVAGNLHNLATLTEDVTEREAVLERALTRIEHDLGPRHLKHLELRQHRAALTAAPPLARARFAAVCPEVDTRLADAMWSRHLCHARLAELAEEQGDLPAALTELALARAALDLPTDPTSIPYRDAAVHKTDGLAALLRGELDIAWTELDAAAAALAAIGSQDHVEVADVAWLGARVLVALGRRNDATPRLAAALAGYAFHRARIVDPAVDTRIRRAQQLLAELDGG